MKHFLLITTLFIFNVITNFSPGYSIDTENKQQTINHINEIYNNFPTITSKFKQIDSLGNESYGWFVLDKKNSKARIEYTSSPLRIIINNNSIMMEQIDLKEKTFSPLISSPLKYIVSKDGRLNNNELNINKYTATSKGYEITVSSKQSSIKGTVTLIFNLKYFLVGWFITDEFGNKTQVSLLNPVYKNNKIPSYVFNTHKVVNVNFNDIK